MKLAVMQPYFFPYIGYFQLMNLVDQWIIFDDVQFINKGWINRNRILHPSTEKKWQYITIPLAGKNRFDKISEIKINNKDNWHDTIYGKLSHYKRKAPYYKETLDIVKNCLDVEEDNLSKLVIRTIKNMASVLGIRTVIREFSDLKLGKLEIAHSGQWALKVSKSVGANSYINPINGEHLFDRNEFIYENIDLHFFEAESKIYSQRREGFVDNLSIIDIMMWNSIESIKEMLQLGVLK